VGCVGEGTIPDLQDQVLARVCSIDSDGIGLDAHVLLALVRRFDIHRSVKIR
jgi:hypothetical protein